MSLDLPRQRVAGYPDPPHTKPTAPIAVVAMGGHAFMQPGERGTHEEHSRNARSICRELMTVVERGYRLVITHGNGPQIGDLMLREESAQADVPRMPLDVLVAQTEGSLGYFLQRALLNELRARKLDRRVVTMVTQVEVSTDDPAFCNPSKPVGPFLSQKDAESARDRFGWLIKEDAGRGWRRLVPSPVPLEIVQAQMIHDVLWSGNIVVAAGGGGIPVAIDDSGDAVGVEAVIDKDLTSGVLATDVGAELLVILTAVDGVYVDWGKPQARRLGAITISEAKRYIDEGHFPAGSMGPKVEAIYGFLQRGGRRGLITSADKLQDALDGQAGTHFIGRI